MTTSEHDLAAVIPINESSRDPSRKNQSRSDDELVLLARGGAPSAFSELVRRHQGRGLRFASQFLGDDSAAKDVVQNAFIEIYRNLNRYKATGKFRAYFHRILLNTCRMHGRSRSRRRRRHVALALEPERTPATDDDILAAERAKDLTAAVAALSPKLRSVVALRYAADLSIVEVAEMLGIPEGTCKSRLFSALAKLRKALGNDSTI